MHEDWDCFGGVRGFGPEGRAETRKLRARYYRGTAMNGQLFHYFPDGRISGVCQFCIDGGILLTKYSAVPSTWHSGECWSRTNVPSALNS